VISKDPGDHFIKLVTKALFGVAYALTLVAVSVSVQAETIKTRIGDFCFEHDFKNGFPIAVRHKSTS
jgi:hypothetical protein